MQVLHELPVLQYDVFIHANVGDDSENPATLAYIQDHFLPFARAHGLNYVQVSKRGATLYQSVMSDNRSVPIPAWLKSGAPGNRTCTGDWKIKPIEAWIKKQGYTHAEIALGYSADEMRRTSEPRTSWHDEVIYAHPKNAQRASKPRKLGYMRKDEYPLVLARLWRDMLPSIIERAGLPVPPKSACWFCPFKSALSWRELRTGNPELFQKAIALENRMNEKRGLFGKDAMRLSSTGLALEDATLQKSMFEGSVDGSCDSGFCHT
jgi:hypothetical protein